MDTALESKVANLKDKLHLQCLFLEWRHEGYNDKADIVQNDEMTQDGHKPHPNLKEFEVQEYMGLRFASWLSWLTRAVKLD